MDSSYQSLLHKLAEAYGVLPDYWDIQGRQHFTTEDTKRRFLEAMGVACSNKEEAEKSLAEKENGSCRRLLEPVYLNTAGESLTVCWFCPKANAEVSWSWRLKLEDNTEYTGSFHPRDLHCCESREVEGEVYYRYLLPLSHPLPLGYQRLTLSCKAYPVRAEALVLSSPRECYLPPELLDGKKSWGLSAQLYGLRSERNWGIGDFTDLETVVGIAAKKGADFIGLNPLHCISPRGDGGFSPYSPSARFALNALYIDVDQAIELLGCEEALDLVSSEQFKLEIAKARESKLVDYARIAGIKFTVFEKLYQHFLSSHIAESTALAAEYQAFLKEDGKQRQEFALFAALQEHFSAKDPRVWGWPLWPESYQNLNSTAVKGFARRNGERIGFYMFVEWLADRQLKQVTKACRDSGLLVGLYLDVALGAATGGAGTWIDRDLYGFSVSMGAPPDALAPQGQDWGLPPLVPHKLREAGYQPFISSLSGSMRYAGALRIDHVMSLMRLYWVPGPGRATEGAYVLYPLAELMAIVRIESQRNKCLVIGEDLGTVPEEVRTAMRESKVLSYKVLYFVKDYSRGEFLSPGWYPPEALVVTSTHDLATLKGFWEGQDLQVRTALKLHEPDVLRQLYRERMWNRFALLKLLVRENLISEDEASVIADASDYLPEELLTKLHMMLARTPCYLQVVQLEDLMKEVEQANLPGTTIEQPNWRRKLPMTLEELATDRRIDRLTQLIASTRGQV